MSRTGTFIKDARRRRVLANAALYIVTAWVAIQVADLAIDAGVIRLALRDVFVTAFLGFPIALIVSWFYDFTRHGLVRTPTPRPAHCMSGAIGGLRGNDSSSPESTPSPSP